LAISVEKYVQPAASPSSQAEHEARKIPPPLLTLSCQILPQLPDTVDPRTLTLSNAPTGGDVKYLKDIANFKIGQVGLKYVNMRLPAAPLPMAMLFVTKRVSVH